MMRKMHWVNPVFVCEIKFAEWTRDKKLRAPVFLGLREDKKPGEVVRRLRDSGRVALTCQGWGGNFPIAS